MMSCADVIRDPVLIWTIFSVNAAVAAVYILASIQCARIALELSVSSIPAAARQWIALAGFILTCGGSHIAKAAVLFEPWWLLEAAADSTNLIVSAIGLKVILGSVNLQRDAMDEKEKLDWARKKIYRLEGEIEELRKRS